MCSSYTQAPASLACRRLSRSSHVRSSCASTPLRRTVTNVERELGNRLRLMKP
jgi:hypothetical protein